MSGAPALELLNIARRFGDVIALNDANLTVARGSVHALLGENGAGKTTLMRIAYGIIRPSAGRVLVNGAEQVFRSPADAIAAGVGMVQQHPSNVEALTVWENVVLGGRGSLSPRRARQAVRALAESVGFALEADALAGELSVAAQQRLEILKAIHRNARLLILDEPTAILAPEEARELYAWLRTFASRGGTAVVVTHKLVEARQFTDALTVLRAGRTVLAAPSTTISTADLTLAMIGESVAERLAEPRPDRGGEVVVKAQRLHVRDRHGISVVREASFEVRAGEVVGLAGVEGSGHHELLMAVAGRLPVTSGTIDGPSRVSLVPEDRHRDGVVLSFSLTENAAIAGAGKRRGIIPWRSLAREVAGFMSRFDVRAAGPTTSMRALSGGNQQKFVLARALDGNPPLIVAENPTRGLDVRAAAFVTGQLRAATAAGAGVLLYSSDLDELLALADRILVVHAGTVSSVPHDRNRIGAAMLGAA